MFVAAGLKFNETPFSLELAVQKKKSGYGEGRKLDIAGSKFRTKEPVRSFPNAQALKPNKRL
jgi:hypothetical protein